MGLWDTHPKCAEKQATVSSLQRYSRTDKMAEEITKGDVHAVQCLVHPPVIKLTVDVSATWWMLEECPSSHQMCILTVKSALYTEGPGCHMPAQVTYQISTVGRLGDFVIWSVMMEVGHAESVPLPSDRVHKHYRM